MCRRPINAGNLPPAGTVRIEEMINYFPYDYPPPKGADPISTSAPRSAPALFIRAAS